MTLPYDIARCPGTTHQACFGCRRREPGNIQWQSYILPAIDVMTGECQNIIPQQTQAPTSGTKGQL
jgi:predicted Fe-S protein YdhL (DUF1289 family)